MIKAQPQQGSNSQAAKGITGKSAQGKLEDWQRGTVRSNSSQAPADIVASPMRAILSNLSHISTNPSKQLLR
jgi:hypothetical protein